MEKKYGFVYLWYDRKHKKYYVGCHWGTENDGYICSCKWMKKAYDRRPEDFKRRILKRVYTNRKDLLDEEHRWLQMINEDELKIRYYNTVNKKFNHWSASERDKVRKTISEKTKEAMARPDVIEKHKEGLKKRNNKSSDKLVRKKRSESMKKTMLKKFPLEQRKKKKKKTKWGSEEFIELHRKNSKKMWQERSENEIRNISNKIQKTLEENRTKHNGINAMRNINKGSKKLIKGNKYKKAKPNSEKWNALIQSGWSIA